MGMIMHAFWLKVAGGVALISAITASVWVLWPAENTRKGLKGDVGQLQQAKIVSSEARLKKQVNPNWERLYPAGPQAKNLPPLRGLPEQQRRQFSELAKVQILKDANALPVGKPVALPGWLKPAKQSNPQGGDMLRWYSAGPRDEKLRKFRRIIPKPQDSRYNDPNKEKTVSH